MPVCPTDCKCGKHNPNRAPAAPKAAPKKESLRAKFFRKLKSKGATHAQCQQYWAEYSRGQHTADITLF